MTALCGGGASGPKPDVGNNIIYNSAGLAAALEFSGYGALATLAVILGTLLYDATTLCGTDPPAAPAFTAAELEALFTITPSTDFENGLAKLRDLVSNVLWYTLCQCTSTTTPAQPAPVALPPTVFIGAGGNANCAEYESGEHSQSGSVSHIISIIPPTETVMIFTADYVNNSILLPAGATSITLTGTLDSNTYTGAGNPASMFYQFNNGAALVGGGGGVSFEGAPKTKQLTVAVPPGATRVTITFLKAFSNVYEVDGHATLDISCGGPNTAAPGGCCPPDPSVVQLLQQVQTLVTLIQRQHVPQAYINGSTHVGVTGAGEIAVSQLLGVKLTPGAIPSHFGAAAGDPDELWLDSWITWGNADGWTPREWLRHSPQISLPSNAHLYTKLGHSFAPGISVDVQELEPEP